MANARKRSAVSSVKQSGFELVPKRKPAGKLATVEDLAKVDFKPWKREKGMKKGELIPSDRQLVDCGVAARLAYAVMLMPRAGLIAMHAKAEHDHVDQMMANISSTAEWLKGVVYMLDTAYLRILASAAAHDKAGGKFKGVDDERRQSKAA